LVCSDASFPIRAYSLKPYYWKNGFLQKMFFYQQKQGETQYD
jgi:hypothetical protein